jgi:hypothetical protein
VWQDRLLAKDFVWELEKLRRRFDVDGDELRAAAKRLSRKRRGEPAFIDDEHLAQMRAGASAREVAKNIGGAYRDEIRISRKNRRAILRHEYWKKVIEFADRIMLLSQAERFGWIDRLTEAARARVSEPHLMPLDISDYLLRKVLDGGRLSIDDTDHLERAQFYLTEIDIDLDTPRRRKTRLAEIEVIETLLQELRAKVT